MDAHLKCAFVALALLTATPLRAQISDPTVPPSTAQTAPMTSASTEAAEPVSANRVQMILRGPGETRTAIVDGRALHVGQLLTIDGVPTRVVRITEGAVVLRQPDHKLQTLELIPESPSFVRCVRAHGTTTLPCATAPELTR